MVTSGFDHKGPVTRKMFPFDDAFIGAHCIIQIKPFAPEIIQQMLIFCCQKPLVASSLSEHGNNSITFLFQGRNWAEARRQMPQREHTNHQKWRQVPQLVFQDF